jgi:High-affinity nickel-transport protein
VVAEKTVFGAVSDSGSGLERFGGVFGTVVSAVFLLLIGLLNLVVLAGIVRVFASMRRGEYDEAELERQLANRGFFYRFFGRWMKVITREWQLYPVGVVFGLGFDTATEVALLATTALLASAHIPWYAILCLPVLFTAGMTFMDTTDGLFMNLAYGWAFFNPVRKVYYNLAITGLSVAICLRGCSRDGHLAGAGPGHGGAGRRRRNQLAVVEQVCSGVPGRYRRHPHTRRRRRHHRTGVLRPCTAASPPVGQLPQGTADANPAGPGPAADRRARAVLDLVPGLAPDREPAVCAGGREGADRRPG